ncbi:MAG: hypothetical protein GF353_21550 [Candidatus Lokiarchaeota archaeon]|nr:hypothetical protein [Candidatus Lokiarchaeota archaeon]
MDSYEKLPDIPIEPKGILSKRFLEMGIESFKEACLFVHNMEYGYNSNYDDKMILFKEAKGSCTTKHAVIAGLAEELSLHLYKSVGIYRFTEEISDGTDEILKKYEIPYVPMIHCFLIYDKYRFDLTEGNRNGKKKPIEEFLFTKKVEPFISRQDEYALYRKALNTIILKSEEMKNVKKRAVLKAREEAIALLKKNIKN